MKIRKINSRFTFQKTLIAVVSAALILILKPAIAERYVIDNGGAHSTIQFKISHLGYSWLWGRFNNLVRQF